MPRVADVEGEGFPGFRALPMFKYTDKYMLWVSLVVAAIDSGWKGVEGAREGGDGCCPSQVFFLLLVLALIIC